MSKEKDGGTKVATINTENPDDSDLTGGLEGVVAKVKDLTKPEKPKTTPKAKGEDDDGKPDDDKIPTGDPDKADADKADESEDGEKDKLDADKPSKPPAVKLTRLTRVQVAAAASLGLTEQDVLDGGPDAVAQVQRAVLEEKIAAKKAEREEAKPKPEDQGKEKSILEIAGITKENEEEYDPTLLKALRTMEERHNALAEQNKALTAQLEGMNGQEEHREARTESIWFDSKINEMGEGYEEFFGKGTIDDVKADSEQHDRRIKLYLKMKTLLAGDPDLTPDDAFKEASIILTADVKQKKTTAKALKDAKDWEKKGIAAPSRQNKHGKETNEEIRARVVGKVAETVGKIAAIT